jgi:kynurenine formamidase
VPHPRRMMTPAPAAREGDRVTSNRASAPPGRITEAEFRSLYERLRGQVPWGADDRRGALNHLGPAQIRAAASEVRLGHTVSLAAPIEHHASADDPAQYRMVQAPGAAADGLEFAADRIAMNIHGNADSHIDALCHVAFDGILYNGVPASAVTAAGAVELSIAIAADGIAGRGVLLDIPRLRGVPWLEPGDHVTPGDITAAERDQGVRISQGDILLVRVGHQRRRKECGAWDAAATRAGLHPSVMPLLAERQIAVLGSDSNNDTAPSVADGVEFPVHVLAINALGLLLLDYLQFDELVPLCEEAGRWSFLCVIAPLRLPTGTGSPVNPIAIL